MLNDVINDPNKRNETERNIDMISNQNIINENDEKNEILIEILIKELKTQSEYRKNETRISCSDNNSSYGQKESIFISYGLIKTKQNFVKIHLGRHDNVIYSSLKQFINFDRFLRFNQINDDSLRDSVAYFRYLYYEKGQIIYDKPIDSQKFFGLIKGKIAIRRVVGQKEEPKKLDFLKDKSKNSKSSSITVNNKIFKIEDTNLDEYSPNNEIIISKPGEYFGDRHVMSNKVNKSTYGIALENTHIFSLDKIFFVTFFSKSIVRAETERKIFIKNSIITLTNDSNFELTYSKMSYIFLDKGQVLYQENSKGNHFYLIFQGECILQKYFAHPSNENVGKYDPKKYKLIDLIKLEKGSFAGLEAIFDTKNSLYKFTLVANNNFSIVIKINIHDICPKTEKNFEHEEFLENICINQMKMLKNISNSHHKKLNSNLKPLYRKIRIIKDINQIKYSGEDAFKLLKYKNGQVIKSFSNDFKMAQIKFNLRNKTKSCEFEQKNETMIASLVSKEVDKLYPYSKYISRNHENVSNELEIKDNDDFIFSGHLGNKSPVNFKFYNKEQNELSSKIKQILVEKNRNKSTMATSKNDCPTIIETYNSKKNSKQSEFYLSNRMDKSSKRWFKNMSKDSFDSGVFNLPLMYQIRDKKK